MPILLALGVLFLGAFALNAGGAAGHALWLPIALALLGVAALALLAWHRRQMATLHGLRLEYLTHWEQESKFRPWPKLCGHCGMSVNSWKGAAIHDDPDTSPCARYYHHRDELERAPALPMEGFTAEVLNAQQAPKPGAREALEGPDG